MWLLNTARAELKFFPDPEKVPGGYAILSHVWDEHEDSFQDIQALRARCAQDGTNPRDLVSEKVHNFCVLAERDGYKWAWDDTCCIDKTSSTDLSEAITAMYRYYSLADVCYAYLRDVWTDCDLRAPDSAFRKSRWHQRGWTLQELIAPPLVILLSRTWKPLGSKVDLARLLEEITLIPRKVLSLEDAPSSRCVAERMAWASNRETTRPEDEAYCLMGLFGIYMPPLYGEGKNAFLRLQEEIVRRLDDPSIFAWGEILDQRDQLSWTRGASSRDQLSDDCLFARSPSDFGFGHHVRRSGTYRVKATQIAGLELGSTVLSRRPTFTITPYALEAYAPVFVPLPEETDLIVIILWGILLGGSEHLGVLLRGEPRSASGDHARPLYRPQSERWYTSKRLFKVPCVSNRNLKFEWKTIHIVHAPPTTEPQDLHLLTRSIHKPFHIPRSHIMELVQFPSVNPFWSFDFMDLEDRSNGTMELICRLVSPDRCVHFQIDIRLGLCPRASESNPSHWATVGLFRSADSLSLGRGTRGEELEHDCAEHHVDEWGGQGRAFMIEPSPGSALGVWQLSVTLSFEPYIHNPVRVRKVHVSLNVHRSSTVAEPPIRKLLRSRTKEALEVLMAN